MATVKKAAKKKTAKKPVVKRMDGLIGHDMRNGKVSMLPTVKDGVNGFTITNERTGFTTWEAARTKALAVYNNQIESSHRQ